MNNILITGGAGFIGSHFLDKILESNSHNRIVVLDKLTYAGNLENLGHIQQDSYTFIEGSINNDKLVREIIEYNKINQIVNFAAETHVDNSIFEPDDFINTNIIGTYNLLKVAKNAWINSYKLDDSLFLHISTDEVFGSLKVNENSFNENSQYKPNSPYSASKASSDHLVGSFHKTFELKTIIVNCSNNFGPRQHEEKLIPKVIKCCLKKENIPIYGKGKNIRDWIYVKDFCGYIECLLAMKVYGETFCIGSRNEISNVEIVKKICSYFSKKDPSYQYHDLITYVEDRPGHDFRYSIEPQKINSLVGGEIKTSFRRNYRMVYKSIKRIN